MTRRALLLLPFLCLLTLAFPAVAAAHPLGNFTINRYSRLEVQPRLLRLRYVLDEAEIPTYQDLALLHPGAGRPTAQEEQAFLSSRLAHLRANLQLAVNGQPLPLALEPGSGSLSFPPGQGGLSLLRVTAWFRAALPEGATTASTRVTFRDDNYSDRLGWKEIIVRAGGGAALQQSSVSAIDQSDELRSYPQDLLSSPLDVRSAQFAFTAAAGAGSGSEQSGLLQPRGPASGPLEAVTVAFTGLVSRPTLSLPFLFFALLAAAALGGAHALSPGHGKTIVGAYLVGSRGSARQAAFLGLTVTVTHTAGVFALGLVTLFASRYIVPEQLYPWLSAGSGLLVAAIGGWLLSTRLRLALRRPPAEGLPQQLVSAEHAPEGEHDHTGAHAHAEAGHVHAHGPADHAHDDAHADHAHGPATHAHIHPHAHPDHGHTQTNVGAGIEHDHGAGRHRHALPAADTITWRGLLGLGISGGLLPCPSALVVLLAAISLHRTAFGIVLVLAFSVGLAGVLTGIGLLMVYARGFFARFPLEARAGKLLPAASAFVVLLLGLAITAQALAQSGLHLL